MRRVLSFGGYRFPTNTYWFPDTQDQFDSNFTNVVTRTTRLPGLSGGFDELGIDEGPREIGNVRCQFWLLAQTRPEITKMRNAVKGLLAYGKARLVVQPADQSLKPVYTFARINNIPMSENAAECIDLHQQVTISFQVADPFWYQDYDATADTWGVGVWGTAKWGGNFPAFGLGSAYAVSGQTWGTGVWGTAKWGAGTQRDLELTNQGNAPALARFIFTASQTCPEGLRLENLSSPVDTVSYRGSIAAGQILMMNGGAQSVRLDGSEAYNELWSHKHPNFLRLLPGVNTVRATLPGGGGGTLRVIYAHTWY
jgi:hypothetical protein